VNKKNGLSYFGYKNSICIDVDHGFIRRYAVTPANIQDSQMLPLLLDPENEHDNVWADSAYCGECFDALLSLGGFESLIHEKGARNHPLSCVVPSGCSVADKRVRARADSKSVTGVLARAVSMG